MHGRGLSKRLVATCCNLCLLYPVSGCERTPLRHACSPFLSLFELSEYMSVTAVLFALPAGESFPVRFAPLSSAACCQNICQLCWFDFPTGRLFETTLLTKCFILFLNTNRNKQTNFSPWDLVNFIHVKFFVSRVGEEGLLRLWQDSLKFLMVGAVRRGQTALRSPIQLRPSVVPVFPWITVAVTFLLGATSATIGIIIWLLTLD